MQLLEAGHEACDRLQSLYGRIVGRFAMIGEKIEKLAGLPPLSLAGEGSEQGTPGSTTTSTA